MELEARLHPYNSFWTLTYSEDNLPRTDDGLSTLRRKHLTDFMKRLRNSYYPNKLRYFNVGEYGDVTERPHYHLALFNYPPCERGNTVFKRRGDCCSVCSSIQGNWPAGTIFGGQLENASAAYICGYVVKKLTSAQDPRLKGREKEFATMSLKPGLGAGFIPEVASAILTHGLDSKLTDVPTCLATGKSVKPLGKYLTSKLRENVGKEKGAPEAVRQKLQAEMQPLRDLARQIAVKGTYSETLKNLVIESGEGRYRRLLGKQSVSKKRSSI